MSDDTQTQLAALQAQLAALQGASGQANAAAPGVSGWQHPAPAAGPAQISGVAVPAKIPFDGGNIKVMFMLPPEAAATPQALQAQLEALQATGIPLDVWRPSGSDSGGWGGRSSGYNRGGYRR